MFKQLAIVVAAVLVVTPALAQNGGSPEIDTSGKGAVLCLMHMLIATQASVEVCKWTRTPTDDVVEKGLSDIAAFAVANSSQPVTREQFEKYVNRELKVYVDSESQEAGYCTADPKDKASEAALPWMLHTMDSAILSAGIADALSVPREPLMNPCL